MSAIAKGKSKMEASTTIRKMIAGNKIIVPAYQRAYSWETPRDHSKVKTHTNVFLSDLDEYLNSEAESSYYFGHFLFEEKADNKFQVIDGQQRLCTIVIFLSALFAKLRSLRGELLEAESECLEDMVIRHSTYRFSTVDYDNQILRDYVIDRSIKVRNGIATESGKRICDAFDFFCEHFGNKDERYLTKMLEIIAKASCTTHIVKNESEAIQMFLFQNNRGKKPSNLEVIKAQFMYNVHLYSGEEKESLLEAITNRFEKIYKSISSIDYKIDEDDVLIYTFRVDSNSLSESSPLEKITKKLSAGNSIPFIKEFAQELALSFDNVKTFLINDESKNYAIHSLVTLGGIGIAFPFIIKAYKFGLSPDTIGKLCESLECLILRHRLIGTRADPNQRLQKAFAEFTETNKSIQPIIDTINMMKKTEDWWWRYWNDTELLNALQGGLNPQVAKYLLWKYENFLESQGKPSGYSPSRFERIKLPELEHIAPITEPTKKPHGYDKYDEEFQKQYLHCLGNYLLVSKSHNCAIGNIPFSEKYLTYEILAQQREIQKLALENNGIWDRDVIRKRKENIIKFIMDQF